MCFRVTEQSPRCPPRIDRCTPRSPFTHHQYFVYRLKHSFCAYLVLHGGCLASIERVPRTCAQSDSEPWRAADGY